MKEGKATKTVYPNGDITPLYLNLPTKKHTKLKMKAAKQKKSMTELIIELIEKL